MKTKALLLAIALGLSGVLFVIAIPGAAQTPVPPVLARIDVDSAESLTRIATLDVPVYAHVTTPDADYLLVVLSSDEQKQLVTLGFGLTVLDSNATDATYYLIENRDGKVATNATSLFTILHDDGRQAVGRLRDGVTIANVDTLNARVKPLLDPIVLAPRATGAIPTAPLYDPLVADLLTHITTETVATHDGGLSGEWAVPIGGAPYTLTTRYTYSGVPIAKATQYVSESMAALGYDVAYHDYTLSSTSLRNVIGEKKGRVHPDQIVLLTAHLDSRAAALPHDPAPGADDNASGSTALLIAAERLADLDFEYTIRLVFFTGEEQGMWGSYYYALAASNAGDDILGVLNLDMIAWDAKLGPDIDLHSHVPTVEDDSDALADLFAAVIDVYDLDLIPQIVENGATFSDHSRFWDRGYAAIMGIEDYYNAAEVAAEPRDWNTNYHTINDRLNTLNLTYFREYVRAGVATFVHLAAPMRELSGTVMSAETVMLPLPANVTAVGPSGAFSTTASVSGTYALMLPADRYTVTASLEGYYPQTFTNITVLTGTGTRLDFVLAPVPPFTVEGSIVDAVNGSPLSATLYIDNGDADYRRVITAPTGFYSTTLFSDTYVITASAPFHWPLARTVIVDRDQRQDFALEPTSCLLVVDDDFDNVGNAYDDQVYYTQTLESLNVSYDLWAVPDDADGPPTDVLERYRGVIWLTGKDWDYTLTTADQSALTAYLDGGGRLFVSGQDIGWDIARNGAPPLYHDYLHATYLRDGSGFYELAGDGFLSGLTVNLQGGDGADNQKFPSDIAVAPGGTGVFHYTGDGDWAATAFANETYRAVYFAFGFEGINSSADRRAVMAYVLDYLQPCLLPPPYAFELDGGGTLVGIPGQTVVHPVRLVNTGMLHDAYDLALTGAIWPTTLGTYSGTVLLPITRTPVLASLEGVNLGISVAIPTTATVQAADQVTLTATSVHNPALSAMTTHRTIAGGAVYLPLVLRE